MVNVNQAQWQQVNNRLNAKILSELHYEELLVMDKIKINDCESVNKQHFSVETTETKQGVELTASNTNKHTYQWISANNIWQFNATECIWGNLIVDEKSLSRNGQINISSAKLLTDIAHVVKLDEIILGNLIEEIQQTLFADLVANEKLAQYDSNTLSRLSGVALQAVLKGHPKVLANKGRLGWGTHELNRYSPEAGNPFQLHFIAVHKQLATTGIEKPDTESHQQTIKRMLTEMMSEEQMITLLEAFSTQNKDLDDYWIIPTHPWQFQHFIVPQFTAQFADDSLIDLGVTGDQYQAQQSIRTLSNITRPKNNDVKLPITILNTSCYRGIPGKYITSGAALSEFIQNLCGEDDFLQQANFKVLKEWAGIHVSNPNQAEIAQTPYRYNEMLGVILRQSPEVVLQQNQQDKLAAALMQTDAQEQSLIKQYIEASGLTVENWLTQLFDTTVVPLYHLMCKYGLALVAHGQNLTLLMEDNVPKGLAIKDFHGDLRIVDQDFPEHEGLPEAIAAQLTKLPAQYLLHDLYTGHFVTVLRFVSPYLADEMAYSEEDFYQLLTQRILHYQDQFPELTARFKQFNLLAETMEKVCINRVRFNVGYQDTSERLLPVLGTPLKNPLFPIVES